MKVEEAKTIVEGPHNATITNVAFESRQDPQTKETYQYCDLHVVLDDVPDITLKAGFPAKITEKTGLGGILSRFGAKLVIGADLDPVALLKGRKITCITKDETNARGTFARIDNSSIMPRVK
jgi:hypothetical protein